MKTVQEPPTGYNESAVMIYQSPDGIRVDVTVKQETVWLNLNQMTALFDRDKSVISRKIGRFLATSRATMERPA